MMASSSEAVETIVMVDRAEDWVTHALSAVAGILASPLMYYSFRWLVAKRQLDSSDRRRDNVAAIEGFAQLARRLESRVLALEAKIDALQRENLEYVRQIATLEAKVQEQQSEIDELRAELGKRPE